MPEFNDRVRQVLVLFLIILLSYLAVRELYIFLPGLLGSLTLYILSRANYFQLVFNRKWKKGRAAFFLMFYYLLIIGLPITIVIMLISPKISAFLADPSQMINKAKAALLSMQDKLHFSFVSERSLTESLNNLTAFLPNLINSTATLISNFIIMLFMYYYMLYHGREIEKFLNRVIPLRQENINILASETKKLVKANALGIPIISIIQGLTAMLGYFIFGIQEFALWGFVTGIFAFFPVIGTMVVWVPLVIYTYVTGNTWSGTGLLIYSLVVTGNVDYVARITLLRKMGDVHPVITVLGVIVGLGLFGFIGLIFGPLLLSYIVTLFRIYMNEFSDKEIGPANGTAENSNTSIVKDVSGKSV